MIESMKWTLTAKNKKCAMIDIFLTQLTHNRYTIKNINEKYVCVSVCVEHLHSNDN